MLWLSSDRLEGGKCSSLLADAFRHRKLQVENKNVLLIFIYLCENKNVISYQHDFNYTFS